MNDHFRTNGDKALVRTIVCSILRLALRTFFKRIEIEGIERVPKSSPVLFVLNHPNGLVDPVFLLCLSNRRVSFLAKEPLFRMPVIGYFVKALDALPVYRQQDAGADTSKNRETFLAARSLLKSGGAIAICPEGVSHNEPRLRPLKTGAARIALGAASSGSRDLGLKVVPAGLYYTAKTTFRSSALLYFGDPIHVTPVALDENGDPSKADVQALSKAIETALRDVMLHVEQDEAVATVARAERIFSSDLTEDESDISLARELELRQVFAEAYGELRVKAPERLMALDTRMRRFENVLARIKLDTDELGHSVSVSKAILRLILLAAVLLLLGPVAVFGTVLNYPAYRLAGVIATRFTRDADDIVSTVKIVAAMLLFPVSWLILASVTYFWLGWKSSVLVLGLAPVSGFVAVRYFEKLDELIGDFRATMFYLFKKQYFLRLVHERKAIREEILDLGREFSGVN